MIPLEKVLDEMEQAEDQEVQQSFSVVDLESAAEAQRRIAYFEEKKMEIDSIIEKQIAPFLEKIEKIKSWGEQAKVEFIDKQSHYSSQLELYLRDEVARQIEAGKKAKKTIKLPYGKISLKAQQPKYEKNDDELLEFAKSVGFFKVKEETKWDELKKNCEVKAGKLIYTETGEIVPGVVVVERDDKFDCKLDD